MLEIGPFLGQISGYPQDLGYCHTVAGRPPANGTSSVTEVKSSVASFTALIVFLVP